MSPVFILSRLCLKRRLPLLTEDDAGLPLHDGTCSVVWVHHLVADLVQAGPPLFVGLLARTPTAAGPVGDPESIPKGARKGHYFQGFWRRRPKKPCSEL